MKNKNKIPMNITIVTKQQTENPQGENVSESVSTNAVGFLRKTSGGMVLEYLESKNITVGNPVTTVSMLDDNIVTVNRLGSMGTYMVFEEGKSHTCVYDTEPVPVQLRIRTNSLRNTITFLGGKLDIDYTVHIAGATAEHSRLSVSVFPHESVITS